LKEVAELFSVDAGNLERAFHSREGVTVKQFIDQQRKKYVTSRLADKGVRGYEVGAELGFTDDLAFYRWVKRAFGISFVKLRKRSKVGLGLDEPKHKKAAMSKSDFTRSSKKHDKK
jgi:AraC-like DNA-binding protein